MVKKKEKKVKIKPKKLNKETQEKTATPTVWNPFDLMESMERTFWDDPWTSFWHRSPMNRLTPRENWFESFLRETDTRIASINMLDKGNEYKITTEMPGVSKKDIEVNVTPNNIKICGETKTDIKSDNEGWIRRERSYSTICRQMHFPEEVNPNKADASLKDGILEITVKKKITAQPRGRKIQIK